MHLLNFLAKQRDAKRIAVIGGRRKEADIYVFTNNIAVFIVPFNADEIVMRRSVNVRFAVSLQDQDCGIFGNECLHFIRPVNEITIGIFQHREIRVAHEAKPAISYN